MSLETAAGPGHDHEACIADALTRAERYCRAEGLRLTPIRRRVLELIWRSHQPSSAYQLLELLTREGHRPSPPTVYRALDFLMAHGLVHRVASHNAFVGCPHPGDAHAAQLFICDDCGVAFEQTDPAVHQRLLRNAENLDFAVRRQTVEISGLCAHCSRQPHGA
jgi:Fur family zinc uptake transcriptional regulator